MNIPSVLMNKKNSRHLKKQGIAENRKWLVFKPII